MNAKNNNTEVAVTHQLPPWLMQMRQALQSAVKVEDVKEIMAKQVELAKKGDRHAARFVLEHAAQLASLKGCKLEVHNHHYHGDVEPDKPTKARPGSQKKLEIMAARVARGQSPFNPGDFGGDEED